MTAIDCVLRLRFLSGSELQETIEGVLYASGSDGTIIEEEGAQTIVRAFFSDDESRRLAAEVLGSLAGVTLQSEDQPRQDWLTLYQQSLRLIEVGSLFVVTPDAALLDADSKAIPIIVPQERAFGTGSHETTWLCLSRMSAEKIAGKRCVDIGTGSGILAIAMLKLGARKVVAFDNDFDTFGVLDDNLMRNDVAGGAIVGFYGGPESLVVGSFDYAAMNIIPEVIIPLLGAVRAALVDGAHLLLSGILLSRRSDVVEAAAAHALVLSGEDERGEWWCGEFVAR